jgi:hypothetical protein
MRKQRSLTGGRYLNYDHKLPLAMQGMKVLYFNGDCCMGRGVGMNAASNSAMICFERIGSDLADVKVNQQVHQVLAETS